MAPELFVDTSAWYPLLQASNRDHASLSKALRAHVAKGARIVTSNLVIAETHALVQRRINASVALTFVRTIDRPPNLIVRATPDLDRKAVEEWLGPYTDQGFSFTDAVSFAIMKERRIRDVLSLDHHFTVAGFNIVGE